MSILPEISLAFLLLAINITLVGAVLALSIVIGFRLAQTAHPRIRYVIAVAAFFLSILLPVWATFGFNGEQKTPIVFVAENSERESPGKYFSASLSSQIESPDENLPQTAPVSTENLTDYFPKFVITAPLSIGLLLLWASVSFLLLGRELTGYARLANRRRKWRHADIEVLNKIEFPAGVPLYLSVADGPFAVGILRQAVVFPARLLADLPSESVKSIARHELNHVHWRDPWVNAILRLIRAIFWFSPPLWYLERVVRLEREAAADFAAIVSRKDVTGFNAAAADYTMTLVSVARWSANSVQQRDFNFAATGIGNQTGLENRVRRLLKSSEKPVRFHLAFAGLVLLGGVFSTPFLPVASQSLPIVLDNIEISEEDNFARQMTNQSARYSDSDFVSQNNESEMPVINSVFVNQTQLPLIQQSDSVISETQQPEGNVEVMSTSQSIQFGNENGFAAASEDITGQTNFTAEQQAAIRKYAVTQQYVEELAADGYENLPIDTLIDMKRLAVSASFIREMAVEGYENLSTELLIDYRRHAVSPAYIREMRTHGYDNLSPQMLLDFKRNAVSTSYIEEMAVLGYRNLPARIIIEFRQQAVSPVFIKEMKELVSGNISAIELINMRKQALTRKFIEELGALGYDGLTANQLINMRANGVTTAFIEKMKARDSKNYSINDLISMRGLGER
jgi:beta-lactamase regulating signal transducer with metallopeptidase domain/DNA-directed RNA polymerase subunit H (RpoH/RPB5)